MFPNIPCSYIMVCNVHSSKCKHRVERDSSQCSNEACSPGDLDGFRCEPQFNILVSLSDCTGSMESVVLAGQAASSLLACSVRECVCLV